MAWKNSRVRSVLTNSCPTCLEGKVFKYNSIFNLKKFDKMHEHCSECGHKFEKENGFFYGAMYASYAVTVAFSVATFVLTYLIYQDTPYWVYIINILVVLIVLAPLSYRAGRLIWINIFNGYNPEAKIKHQQKIQNYE